MAQPLYPNPTLQAKIGSSTTEVNLRDWLNTRLAPFLKRAITESLDSEAQYPLQWLGEHLIQQSILFEGNPDSTSIKERFLYNHDNATKSGQGQGSGDVPVQSSGNTVAQNTLDQSQGTPAPIDQQTPQATTQNEVSAQPVAGDESVTSPDMTPGHSSAIGVNGTAQAEQALQAPSTQDAEMSNAP
ncbi:hypothetical protein H2198_004646 [Neophaeococcomyces mojaviensis]|uniref:Uncharacterized protein n=1 Tax=Neophaeococcomyces mojaviensis TaxID=3383035 RepID=A0ACC3A8E8_9EURO|nr:hypothetical protein H2198_004646 [Knufia sp. JES_112]